MAKDRPKQQRGHPVVSFRCENGLINEVEAYCTSTLHSRRGDPLTRNAFIVAAIKEKLAHIKRSKGSRKPKSKAEKVADNALAFFA